jgi:hypothetical protein
MSSFLNHLKEPFCTHEWEPVISLKQLPFDRKHFDRKRVWKCVRCHTYRVFKEYVDPRLFNPVLKKPGCALFTLLLFILVTPVVMFVVLALWYYLLRS